MSPAIYHPFVSQASWDGVKMRYDPWIDFLLKLQIALWSLVAAGLLFIFMAMVLDLAIYS